MGEIGRPFSTCKKEHQKECEKEAASRLIRVIKEQAQHNNLKSDKSDDYKKENFVKDWTCAGSRSMTARSEKLSIFENVNQHH